MRNSNLALCIIILCTSFFRLRINVFVHRSSVTFDVFQYDGFSPAPKVLVKLFIKQYSIYSNEATGEHTKAKEETIVFQRCIKRQQWQITSDFDHGGASTAVFRLYTRIWNLLHYCHKSTQARHSDFIRSAITV